MQPVEREHLKVERLKTWDVGATVVVLASIGSTEASLEGIHVVGNRTVLGVKVGMENLLGGKEGVKLLFRVGGNHDINGLVDGEKLREVGVVAVVNWSEISSVG